MAAIIVLGVVCLVASLFFTPVGKLDLNLLVLTGCTLILGPRAIVRIPEFKSHISVSDIFVFLTLLLYGGELAILLSAIEAFLSARRFCSRRLTIIFNAATMAVSTTSVVLALRFFAPLERQYDIIPSSVPDFLVTLSIIAVTQFLVNTAISCVGDALRNGLPVWETWKNNYIWTFLTYFVGAAGAGLLVRLVNQTGFGVLFAGLPIILFVFLSYRMYLKNVEMSIDQARQAREYADALEKSTSALRESEQRFRSAFNHAPIGIALVSPTGKWLRVNRALCDIFGYSAEQFCATDFQSMIFADDLGDTLIQINRLLAGKAANGQLEQRYIHKDGHTVWAAWSVSAAGDELSHGPNLIFQIQDITDRKLAEQRLRHEATHDALTGLPNRAMFMFKLSQALQMRGRDPEHRVSVLFIDLDRFKYVNDSLGHLVGDQLLIAIAARLRDCVRPADIVARLGGDEFTMLIEGRYDTAEVTRIAERIQQKFAESFNPGGHVVYSSASIGILHATEKHRSAQDMMRDADTAMYHAKRTGMGRHQVFDEDMHEAAKETLRLETDLRLAVENEEITVAYQPIFSLATGRIEGVEALARWRNDTRGDVSPSKFIPIAEEIGLIDALGEQVMHTACRQIGRLDHNFRDISGFYLSVNLSCKQFGHQSLVKRVRSILDSTAFPANKLKIEITESVFLEHNECAGEMLRQLCELGIEVDIDDFGTGYSNLGYLSKLPVSTLKIDRSFIDPIDENGANTEIVRTILSMARNLGLKVVAEGVETPAQLTALKNLECTGAQGRLLAPPMSLADLKKFLQSYCPLDPQSPQLEGISVVSTLQ